MENTKTKKVGTFTIGFCLILIGIAAFTSMFIGIKVLKYTLYAWPIILILIGAEILYYSTKENITLKYDLLGIILLCFIFGVTIFGSIASQALNDYIDNRDYYIEKIAEYTQTQKQLDCIDKINN